MPRFENLFCTSLRDVMRFNPFFVPCVGIPYWRLKLSKRNFVWDVKLEVWKLCKLGVVTCQKMKWAEDDVVCRGLACSGLSMPRLPLFPPHFISLMLMLMLISSKSKILFRKNCFKLAMDIKGYVISSYFAQTANQNADADEMKRSKNENEEDT